MSLLPYLLRRFVGFLAVMVGVSIITFGLSHLVPADPAVVALGDHASEAQIDAVTAVSGSGPAYVFLLVEALAAARCKSVDTWL